nr:hypothetical protein [Actinoplanes subtropicus]
MPERVDDEPALVTVDLVLRRRLQDAAFDGPRHRGVHVLDVDELECRCAGQTTGAVPRNTSTLNNNTTTIGYDLVSPTASVNELNGTQTLSYNDRGLLSQVVDSQAGTFTAGYDPDVSMITKGLPDAPTVTTGYDETGTATTQSTSERGVRRRGTASTSTSRSP